jgi:AsmA-like C-terminal region/AsmA family
MTSKTRKRLLRFILLPFAILLVLIVLAVAVLYSQQQRLVNLAVNELNKRLPGELVVGGSEISLFQNFPYISIALNKVQFYADKRQGSHPIYEVERLYVGFSLPDVLKQKYRVKAIALKNGHLDLVEEPDGQLNIIEASKMTMDATAPAQKTSSDLDLDIRKLVLKNMTITYLDSRQGQHLMTHIDRIQASFKDNDTLIDAGLDGKFQIDYTCPGDTVLFRRKHVETDIRLTYEKATKMLRLPEGKLKLEEAVFNVTGTADLLHDNLVDLKFTGDKPDFRQLFAFAPESLGKELKNFRYDGTLSFDGRIKGNLGHGRQPLIELSFACKNAWLHNTVAKKNLDSVTFRGFYTNGAGHSLQTSELRLLDMNARPGKGLFRGNFVLRDFTDPKIMMQLNSDLELSFIGDFLGIKDLERITGHINLKMNFKELVDFSAPEKELTELSEGVQSELKVTDLTFRIPHYPFMIEHVNLHAAMKNGFLLLDTLSFNVGHSDFHIDGSLTDLPALFHQQEKPVTLTLNLNSSKVIVKELLASDSALDKEMQEEGNEEIRDLSLGLSLETSVYELQHPRPLPKGTFRIGNFEASFKKYPHAFHDFSGQLTINDTSLLLKNLAGQLDSSDIRFSGRVNKYALWFAKEKKGKTVIAFDLKSKRLAVNDLLGSTAYRYVPKDIQQEVATGVWLRSKAELRYDSVFRFANIRIANISGSLQKHPIRLDSISGNIKFGTDNFIKIDTLKGIVGNSDFNLSMRLYAGKDTVRRKKENFLQFSSRLLDADQLSNYAATAEAAEQEEVNLLATAETAQTDSVQPAGTDSAQPAQTASQPSKTASAHANAFNIFAIPFIDFNATVNIGKLRYHHLGIKNLVTNVRMQANQQLYLDTLSMDMAGGNIAARAHFNGSDPKKIFLKSRITVRDVNLEKLMLKADYFGQDYVINKNIRGTLNGQIKSYILVHPDLTPQIDQSEAQLDVEIHNGVLVNFAPMQAMSSFFSDKNLMMVRFDTLRDVLTLKNGALSIPGMNINSSLGFMEISGTQSLDMHMEYYLRIPLKLVTQAGFHKLFGKKQEEVNPDQEDAIEYRDKEKRVHFINIKITGTPDEYKVGLGKSKKTQG